MNNHLARSCKRTLVATFAVLSFIIFGQPAYAFRLRTHLWVGQSVINDLRTSTNITLNGKFYAVDPQMRAAILAHPDSYLAGCLGPDIVPDLVVGQMTTHPGIQGGWRSREWLAHVLQTGRNDERTFAFALGYLSHAASDVFAHTYVNTYTGDVFILSGEQEVEQRHFALESYIDRCLPPIAGLNNYGNCFSFPKATLARALIRTSEAQNEYKRPEAWAGHLVTMVSVRDGVKELGDRVRRLEEGLAGVLEDVRKKLGDAQKEVASVSGPVAQLELQIKAQQEIVIAFEAEVKLRTDAVREADKAISSALTEIQRLNQAVDDLQKQVVDAGAKVATESANLARTQQNIVEEIVDKVIEKLPWPLKDFVKEVKRTVTKTNPAWLIQKEVLEKAQKHLDDIKNALQANIAAKATQETLRASKEAAKLSTQAILAELELKRGVIDESRKKLEQLRAQLKPLKEKEAEILSRIAEIQTNLTGLIAIETLKLKPLSSLAKMWLSNIDRAIEEYVSASEKSARELLSKGNPLSPYLKWHNCWAPVFMGVPREIPNTECLAKEEAEKLHEMVSELRGELHKKLGDLAWVVDPMGKIEVLAKEKLVPELKRGAVDLLGQVAGDRTKQMAKLLFFEPDDKTLVETFTGSTKKSLVEIPDIVARLRHDLHVNSSGQLDPERFYALRNAVALSKIVLLSQDGTARLEKDHNIRRGFFEKRHSGTDAVLTGVLSIDGNHQWRHQSPLYIRKNGTGEPDPEACLPYSDRDSANYLFKLVPAQRPNKQAIFFGPLVPSIETPKEGGFFDIRSPNYSYTPSASDPFPQFKD